MSAEQLTQCARNVLDAWGEAGWNVGFDAAMRAMREALAAHEALSAAPAEPVAWAMLSTRQFSWEPQPPSHWDWTPLYTHPAPQPQPAGTYSHCDEGYKLGLIQVDRPQPQQAGVEDDVIQLLNHIEDVLPDEAWELIDAAKWNAVTKPRWAASQSARKSAAPPPQPTAPAPQAQGRIGCAEGADMNLPPVIQWLENGCDPKEAAKELRLYQQQAEAHAKSEPAASDESLMQILHDPENQPSQYGTVPMDWVPPGFWLAPDEPSEAMCKAAVIDFNGPAVYKSVAMEALAIEEGIYGDMYKAMRAAHLAATQGGENGNA